MACDSRIPDPMVPDFGEADEDLTTLLEDLVASVLAVPESSELRGRLAMAYDINGFPDAAISTYHQAEALDPSEFSWPYYRALLLGQSADFQAALAALDKAIAIDGDYVPAWLWRGAWLLELDRYEEATSAHERAAALGAGSPATVGMAQALLDQERYEEAVALLEPVNETLPHPHIHRMLGRAYRALGRMDDARVAMARGRQAEPMRWMDPRVRRRTEYIGGFGQRLVHAQDLIRSNLPREALRIIEDVRESHPDDPILISTLAWAYTSAGELERALHVLRDGLEKFPDYRRFHLYFARVFLRRGDRARLREHLEIALEWDPRNAWAHEQLGRLAADEGRSDEALAAFDRALKFGADSPVTVLYTAGLIEGARGNWDGCVGRFQRAVAVDEAFAIGYIYLGRCRAEAGDLDGAEDALRWAERLGGYAEELADARRLVDELQAGDA